MKLMWSSRSPFVRKVMLFAHEAGLADRIELEPTVVTRATLNPVVLARNPLVQLPTLITDAGDALYDSAVICDYLDSLHAGPRMIPQEGPERWRVLRIQALADGLLDILLVLRPEQAKPDGLRNDGLIGGFLGKRDASLNALAREAERFDPDAMDMAQISTFAALGYLDFRYENFDWRAGRPALASWCAGFAERPSARATPMYDPR